MDKKKLAFGSVLGALFVLAVLASTLNEPWCLLFTAVFWTLAVLKLRQRMARYPFIRAVIAVSMLLVGYPGVVYIVMGLGDDLTGLFNGVLADIAGLAAFPIREETLNVVRMVWAELLKVKEYALYLADRSEGKEALALKWSWHYLFLGTASSCIIAFTALHFGLCVLAALGSRILDGTAEALNPKKRRVVVEDNTD